MRRGSLARALLNFYFRAAMVGYFDALAGALRGDHVDESEFAGIAGAHAMEIVGPPSDRYV